MEALLVGDLTTTALPYLESLKDFHSSHPALASEMPEVEPGVVMPL